MIPNDSGDGVIIRDGPVLVLITFACPCLQTLMLPFRGPDDFNVFNFIADGILKLINLPGKDF